MTPMSTVLPAGECSIARTPRLRKVSRFRAPNAVPTHQPASKASALSCDAWTPTASPQTLVRRIDREGSALIIVDLSTFQVLWFQGSARL
jgi:hypothetical protein